jgi:hypothetical protein
LDKPFSSTAVDELTQEPLAVISDDVRRFVLTSIPSVPYLEAMLLFLRAPHGECTRADLADALYISNHRATELLAALVEGGVIEIRSESESRYGYFPRDDALAEAIDRLAEVYKSEMIGITHLIHDASGKNAQRFADAFKLRKDR